MISRHNTAPSKEPTTDLAWEGVKLGVKTGMIVSTLYALLWVVGSVVAEISLLLSKATNVESVLVAALIFGVVAWIFAIVPATVLGAFTGMYLGQLSTLTRKRISSYAFLSLCISSCFVLVVLFHILFQIPVTFSSEVESSSYSLDIYGGYPFSIGIPSVIYVFTSAWVGSKLYAEGTTQTDGQE
jgi:hypothetical protein